MCRTRSLSGRLAALLALVLQLALGAALPLAHARIEAAGLPHQVHIEAEGGGYCLPHTDFDCQLCRQQPVADLTSDSGTVPALPLTHVDVYRAGFTSVNPPTAPPSGAIGPRAPPLA